MVVPAGVQRAAADGDAGFGLLHEEAEELVDLGGVAQEEGAIGRARA